MNNGEDVGFIRSLVDEDLDGFRQKFESFLDRCQPFPSYVGMGRFLSVFFSSVFITARFAGIINKNERVYIRFDNHDVVPGNADLEIGQRKTGNLKVAVLTDQLKGEKRIVRYYTISDRWNSEGSRFSEIEKAAVERRIVGQNQGLEGNLDSEEYKISVQGYASTQGERGAITVQNLTGDGFTGYSASEFAYYRRELGMHLTTNEIREGIARNLQLPGRNIAREYFENNINFTEFAAPDEIINNPIENLANADVDAVSQQYIDIILDRATQFYNQHREISGFNISGAKREFEDRGFWLGVLATFSYHYTVDIDLSPANSCVTFLVRCQAERRNVPIVVNFATGGGDGALSRAKDYAKGLHSSSYISIHTESEHAVCVGLNLNQATFSVDTVEFLKNRLHFVEKLFKRVQDRQNGEIQEETRNFLLHHLPREIPIDEGNLNRRFDYMTGFTFGSSAFDIRPVQLEEGDEAYVTRCILRYGNENLRRSVLTIVFHASRF